MLRMRDSMRPLRDIMPERAGCADDGALHPAGHGLRADMPDGGQLHVPGQRICRRDLQHVRGDLRGLRRRMRAAPDGALPAVRGSMPQMRGGMQEDGFRCADERNGAGGRSDGALNLLLLRDKDKMLATGSSSRAQRGISPTHASALA